MTTAAEKALSESSVSLALFFEGEFKNGFFLRLWTGNGSVTWNGHSWLGSGTFLSVGDIRNSDQIAASQVSVVLSGIPTEIIQKSISEVKVGGSGKIWLAPFSASGGTILDPFLIFHGRLDVPSVTDGAATCEVRISYESRLIDLNRKGARRYNHEGQQALFPGDKGFGYVSGLQDKEVIWGQPL